MIPDRADIYLVPVEGAWSLVWNMAVREHFNLQFVLMQWHHGMIQIIYTPIFYGGSHISYSHVLYIIVYVPGSKLLLLGMVIRPVIVNPYNGYI